MGKSFEFRQCELNKRTSNNDGGAYAYAEWLANKYRLNEQAQNRIFACVNADLEKSRYMEQTISYVVFALTSEGRKDYEISEAISTLLKQDKCPTVTELESLLSICVSAGNSIYEVVNTPYLYDGRFTPNLLYAELQLVNKGRDKVNLKNLIKLNRKLNDKQREGIMKLYPLSNRTKFMAYANLRMQEKDTESNVNIKTHSL